MESEWRLKIKEEVPEWVKKMPPVYNKTRMLLLQFMASTKKCPREMKYGMIANTTNDLLYMMKMITKANDAFDMPKERIVFIEKAQEILDDVRISARVLFDAGVMKKTGFHAITQLEAEAFVQLKSWKASELKKTI